MKIKNIYVVRHGETDWNKNNRFQGQTDIKINDLGREQAVALRPFLQQLNLESIYSSPLLRAYETAEIATVDMQLQIHKDDRLRETNIGDGEGLTLDEIQLKFGEEFLKNWRSYDERLLDFHFPNGESKRQMMYRVRQVFLEIAQNTNRNTIGVFTHGMVMRAMTYVFGQGVPWGMNLFSNGCVHHYQWIDESAERLIYKGRVF